MEWETPKLVLLAPVDESQGKNYINQFEFSRNAPS